MGDLELDNFEYSTDGAAQSAYVSNASGNLQVYSEATIKTQGSYSLKAIADTSSDGKTLTHILSPASDLSGVNNLKFDMRSNRTGENVKLSLLGGLGAAIMTDGIVTSVGSSLDFGAGNTTNYITLDSAITLGENGTISVWAKDVPVASPAFNSLLGQTGTIGYVILLYNSQVYVGSASGTEQVFWNNSVSDITLWNHYCVVKTGNNVEFFVNGVSLGSPQYLSQVANIERIGYAQSDTIGDGKLDEICIFNRALSSAEVALIYNGGSGLYANTAINPYKTGLTNCYHFNDAGGKYVIDNISGNNGTIIGTPTWVDGMSYTIGGTRTEGEYTIHEFATSGTLITSSELDCEVLVVAGGGGGGQYDGAGGGAGGILYDNSLIISAGSYTVTVGAGGVGQGTEEPWYPPLNGGDSTFSTLTAIGGGKGAQGGGSTINTAGSGGSGGGGSGTPGSELGGIGTGGTNLIPVMTSDTSPSGMVFYSNQSLAPPYVAFQAFQNMYPTTEGGWATTWTGSPEYIGYQFTSGKTAKAYTIISRNEGGNSRVPKTWTFEGSNDGENYDVLDTQSNVTNWAYLSNIKKSFAIANTTSYTYYRIVFTDCNDASYIGVGTVQIFDANTMPQGFNGGDCASADYYAPAGGGGGAGGQGGNSEGLGGDGHGGIGREFSQFSNFGSPSGWFSGGGGGGSYAGSFGIGGKGGGANGIGSGLPNSAVANTGGGAGGGGDTSLFPNGGSGIVIVKYLTPASIVISELTPNIGVADQFQTVNWDIKNIADLYKKSIPAIKITIVDDTDSNTFYLDNFKIATCIDVVGIID